MGYRVKKGLNIIFQMERNAKLLTAATGYLAELQTEPCNTLCETISPNGEKKRNSRPSSTILFKFLTTRFAAFISSTASASSRRPSFELILISLSWPKKIYKYPIIAQHIKVYRNFTLEIPSVNQFSSIKSKNSPKTNS